MMATPSAAGRPDGVHDRLDVGLVDDQVVGAGVDRQAAVGPRGGVVEGDDHARAGERHQGRGERTGVPGGLGGRDGAVPGRRLLGQPLDLALQLGQLLVLPGDDPVALRSARRAR